ncbi:hypothetical protein ACFY2J_38845 [Streptomyces collinus]|uniref:hypothetical protein n=1 Tax=Streptomyces collinus TaxID=42684 RepID=UPI003699B4FB
MAVLEMLGPEGVITASMGLLALGVREWVRVQLARERRRIREYELLAKMFVEVADIGRGVQVRHEGASGDWTVTYDGGSRQWDRRRRESNHRSQTGQADEGAEPAHRSGRRR